MAFTFSRAAVLCYCFKTAGEAKPNSISKLSRSFSSSACVLQLVSDVAAVKTSSLLIHRKVKQWWFELGITFDFVYAATHPSNPRLQHLCLSRLTVSPSRLCSFAVDLCLSSEVIHHRITIHHRGSRKLDEQQWPLLALFHIWSLDFWVYSFLPSKVFDLQIYPFQIDYWFLIVQTRPSLITRTSPWTFGSFPFGF